MVDDDFHVHQVCKACADVCQSMVTVKQLTALTKCWWVIRLEVTPAWLAIEISAAMPEVGLQHCGRGSLAGAEHIEEDEGDAQMLTGTLHSTWQTDTKPPSSPVIICRDRVHDNSHKTLGAFFCPPARCVPTVAVHTTARLATGRAPRPGQRQGPYSGGGSSSASGYGGQRNSSGWNAHRWYDGEWNPHATENEQAGRWCHDGWQAQGGQGGDLGPRPREDDVPEIQLD